MPSINIYKIKFDNNEKEYIGATKLNLSSRKASFKRDMRKIYGNENNIDNMTDFYKMINIGVKNTISLINKLDYNDKSEITTFIDNLIKNNNNYEKITSKKSKISDKKAYFKIKNEEYKNKKQQDILNKINDDIRNKLFNYMLEEIGKDKMIKIIQKEYLNAV
jgi:hypothetical protein